MLATRPHRLAVLDSGDRSDCEALTRAAQRGKLGGPLVLLLCDVPDAQVLVRAERRLHPRAVCRSLGGPRQREDRRVVFKSRRAEPACG